MCHNYTYEALTTALQSLKYTNTHTSDVRTRIHTLFSTHKHTQAVCWLMELFFSLMSVAVVLLSTVPLITSVFTRFFPLFSALLHLCLPLHLLLFYCVLLSFFHSYFHLIVSNSNRGAHVMCSPVAVFFLPLFIGCLSSQPSCLSLCLFSVSPPSLLSSHSITQYNK